MKKRNSGIVILTVLLTCWVLMGSSCDTRATQQAEESYQAEVQLEQLQAIGFPNISNYFEKKTLKNILELRDQSDLICYAYSQNLDGQFVYIGKCIGFGIPYGTQYTNPDVYSREGGSLPQADPNGLYSSGSTDATWIMLINETTGAAEIMYSEATVNVSQSKLPARLCADWSLPSDY